MTLCDTPISIDQSLLPTFSAQFLDDHAKRLIHDPRIALMEICANAWDAGADSVSIRWPQDAVPEVISIEDNGTGMTQDEFLERWLEINYNRRASQGELVIFPTGNRTSRRRAFGRNGKGRNSMFCFSEEYYVETWRDGSCHSYRISRPSITSRLPFLIDLLAEHPQEGHGTRLWTTLGRHYLPVSQVRDLIGSKFIADPSFSISINGEPIQLESLDHLLDTEEVPVSHAGSVVISQVDTTRSSRTSRPHGVAWWVNRRLVGEISWDGFRDAYDIDRRTVEAKRFTFVVLADLLADEALDDWSGFQDSDLYRSVRRAVEANIQRRILASLKDVHHRRKKAVLENNAEALSTLPADSRYIIGQAIEQIQCRVPSIPEKTLDAAVGVLVNLEQARTGSLLLEQLAELKPGELDQLSEILENWSVQEARIVLGELEKRLKIIRKLEVLVEDPKADELHEIHPLFSSGLWIFGPEYESIHFTSNRTLVTTIQDLFKDRIPEDLRKDLRPDFVALHDSTIGVYASNSFDSRSEVNGFDKVLIVELKRGGYRISIRERRQGEDYARELRKTGKIQPETQIDVFVLGSEISPDLLPIDEGRTRVYPRSYEVILQQAHARTFFLLERIKQSRQETLYDMDVEEIMRKKADGKEAFPINFPDQALMEASATSSSRASQSPHSSNPLGGLGKS
jgi:hypothetical protein